MTHPVASPTSPDVCTERSAATRGAYLERVRAAAAAGPGPRRPRLRQPRPRLRRRAAPTRTSSSARPTPNVAIVSSLQRHALGAPAVRATSRRRSRRPHATRAATAQFAGGVPAMCDGITQGRAGMELSLFSRDVIAMATAIALSHDMFDAALMLGVCDKIVPGLLIGALSFGHLPTLLRARGPDDLRACPTAQKTQGAPAVRRGRDRPRRAARRRGRRLPRPRHLHVLRHRQLQPDADGADGAAPARRQPSSTRARRCARRSPRPRARAEIAARAARRRSAEIVDERAVVNGVVGAAGHRRLDQPHDAPGGHGPGRGHRPRWDDFADLSAVVPLLARDLPQRRGRRQPLPRRGRHARSWSRELARRGPDAPRRADRRRATGSTRYTTEPHARRRSTLTWRDRPRREPRPRRAAPGRRPVRQADGGLRMLRGQSRPRGDQDLRGGAGAPR